MASIRGILNIQSLNELTSENQPRPWSHEERIAARRIDRRGARSLHGEGETSGRLAGPAGPTGAPEKRPGPQHAPRLIGDPGRRGEPSQDSTLETFEQRPVSGLDTLRKSLDVRPGFRRSGSWSEWWSPYRSIAHGTGVVVRSPLVF